MTRPSALPAALAVVAVAAALGFLTVVALGQAGLCCRSPLAAWVAAVGAPTCALGGGWVGGKVAA
jgi:hypothetical protein